MEVGLQIAGDDFAAGWARYVATVYAGTEGWDGTDQIRERFGITITFFKATDFALAHPAMNLALQQQYTNKLLTDHIDEELGGSYGYRLTKSYGMDQVQMMVERLADRPESKSACANLLHPQSSEFERSAGMKRTACLAFIQALVRNGQLNLLGTFRSQNAVNSHGNFRGLHELHVQLTRRLVKTGLNVERGDLVVHVNAAHVFEKDFPLASDLAAYGEAELVPA
jgi:thymidylate synthase